MKYLAVSMTVEENRLKRSNKKGNIMLNLFEIIMPIVLIAIISLPLVPVFKGKLDVRSAKFRMYLQISLFFATLCGFILFAGATYAAEAESAFVGSNAQGMGFLSAAIAVSASVIGAGYAVGQAAPAAIGAISENPDNFGKAMIYVVLGEGVAIYGLLIAILIIQKL